MTIAPDPLATSSTVAPPQAGKASTPRLLVWAVSLLGGVTLLGTTYTKAVEAISEAEKATKKAFAAEPLAEGSYAALSKTINQLAEQLKDTQSELALLAEYLREHPRTAPPAGHATGTLPNEAGPHDARPSATPPSSTSPRSPASASRINALPGRLAERARTLEAQPIVKPVPFAAVRSEAKARAARQQAVLAE